MKKIITTIALAAGIASVSAFSGDNVLTVSNVTRENGKTKVSFSRDISRYNEYTATTQTYSLGAFTKTFNGNLNDEQIAEKASRYVDDFITVQSGSFKKAGQNYKLAEKRSKAFFANGYEGYFAELSTQLSDEK